MKRPMSLRARAAESTLFSRKAISILGSVPKNSLFARFHIA